MKKIISLILAVAMVTSVAAIPTSAATDPFADKVAGRIPQDAWTAREVPEGTTVTLLPDYSEDKTLPVADLKNGGFETTNSWSDALNAMMFWQDGGSEKDGNADWKPWTFSTDVKIEGNQSGCVDISPAMAEKSKQTPARLPFMAFTSTYITPCFGDEVYHLRFYVKADRELGAETPQVMVYLLDPSGGNGLNNVVGAKNVMLDASNIDYHWYDQNEIKFEQGQNPTGKYTQGFGPFYQGKWIQIDSYFKTPEDFAESAGYAVQIHTQTGADCKLYFDAFSLEKITMDQVDMGIALKATEKPASVKFTKKSVKIKKGKKVTLKVTLKGAKKATFSVDKKGKKVVKLSKKKAKSVVVTGKKKGKATITAKAAGKKATCKVTVK